MTKQDIKQLELLDAQILGYTLATFGGDLTDLLIGAGIDTPAELQEYKKHFELSPNTKNIIKREIDDLKQSLEQYDERLSFLIDEAEINNKITLLKELIK